MMTLTTDPTNDVFNAPNPHVNMPRRYGTVAVHYIHEYDVRMIKWFSDIQMAWMWIRQRVNTVHRDAWDMNPFLTCVYDMDSQWNVGDGEDGMVFAENAFSSDYEAEYRAYYKPDVKYDDIPVADREQHF